MELISERVHISLAYLAAVNRAGAKISLEQFEVFAAKPNPAGRRVSALGIGSWVESLAAIYETVEGAETIGQFVLRVGWAEGNETVSITALGKAVLAEAARPPKLDPSDEPLTVTIDPADPLAYTRIFHLISSHGGGLLVDRYLTLEGLADIIDLSSVDRVLTGDDPKKNRLKIFSHALSASTEPPAVHTVPGPRLHDRFFIPDEGPIYVLGSSLNSISSRPGVVTPISDPTASQALRDAYEALWADGTTIVAEAPSER